MFTGTKKQKTGKPKNKKSKKKIAIIGRKNSMFTGTKKQIWEV